VRTLILIANCEWASLIHLEGNHFEVIEECEHPQSKEKVEHLVSDRPGRTFSRVSAVRHSLNEGQDVLGAERQKFAREVVELCKKRHQLHPFHELWIVTGPKFLGELRHLFLSISSLPYTIREIHKEISRYESLEGKMGKIQAWIHGNTPKKRSSWKSESLIL
jgi:protein required for attachment to host cells